MVAILSNKASWDKVMAEVPISLTASLRLSRASCKTGPITDVAGRLIIEYKKSGRAYYDNSKHFTKSQGEITKMIRDKNEVIYSRHERIGKYMQIGDQYAPPTYSGKERELIQNK